MDEVAYTEMMGHRQAMYLARISTLEAQLKDAEELIEAGHKLLTDEYHSANWGREFRVAYSNYRTKYGEVE